MAAIRAAPEDDRPRLQALFCNPERPTREARSLELKLQRNAGGSGGKSDMLTFSVNTEPVLGRQGACGASRIIAMATHRHGIFQDVLRGSVAHAVRHRTRIPVLMVPSR